MRWNAVWRALFIKAQGLGGPQTILPAIGPFSSSLRVDNLPDLKDTISISGFTITWVKTSRTAPLKCKNFDLTPAFGCAVGPDPSSGFGYSFFTRSKTLTINSGQAIFTTWAAAQPYPDGSIIDGVAGTNDGSNYFGGQGGSGGSGGSGGGSNPPLGTYG